MNKRVALLVVTVFAISSCSKNKSHGNAELIRGSNAEIITVDPRMCATPCCGGFEITIDNATYPNGGHFYYVYKIPKDFILGNNSQFPVAVKIDYTIDATDCGENYVDITSIEKR